MDQVRHNQILESMADPNREQNEAAEAARLQALELQRKAMEVEREFQSLCFEIFHVSENGKRLYEIILNRWIIPAQFLPTQNNAPNLGMYWEGFKDAFRGLFNHGLIHKDRIQKGGQR